MNQFIIKHLWALTLLLLTALPLRAAEVVTYYHNDQLGSPIAATDSAGTVVWQQAYDPWGLKLTTNTDARGYTGNWLDEETGLADHKARWYTSSIGRFTAIDPVKWHESNIHSFNRYAYGNNSPYSYTDRNGELAFPLVLLAAAGFEFLGIATEVATMEETQDSINRSGAGSFGIGGVKATKAAVSAINRISNSVKINVVDPRRAKHIFRNKEGHLSDTPKNRKLLENIANKPSATLGKDKFGNTWSAQNRSDGTQVWTQDRGGKIINGGLNKTPRKFNQETGLSSPKKPRQ